jgi:methionyl-tRNA synthetase
METKNLLITTAISYTNGGPHIGHLYESVLADFLKKSFGFFTNVKLLTGTDEHGKKIELTAQSQNISPIELCDSNSVKFKQLNDKLGVDYDHFIRTTDQAHKELVTKSIHSSNLSGDIYLDNYTGYYNVREETFVNELEASQNNFQDPVTGKPLEKITESSYFFKLSKYQDYIKKVNDSKLVFPSVCFSSNSRLNDLKDLSISRTSFNWGIDFPTLLIDPEKQTNLKKQTDSEKQEAHIVYVWFDALLNYVTGSNILFDPNESRQTIHLIGKDIVWFHSVIYPAILKSCNYEHQAQAKNILVHGFILDKNGIKMSKSLGNVIDVDYLLEKYPIEAIRYYLIMETIWGEDIKFNEDRLKELYNNQLIKDFGNLFQRLFTLSKPIESELNEYFLINSNDIKTNINNFLIEFEQLTSSYSIYKYKTLIQSLCAHANKELTDKKPWTYKSIEKATIKIQIIGDLIIELIKIMNLLYPIIPNKIIQMKKWLGLNNNSDIVKLHVIDEKIKAFDII